LLRVDPFDFAQGKLWAALLYPVFKGGAWRCRMGQNYIVDKFSNIFGQPVFLSWQVFSLPRCCIGKVVECVEKTRPRASKPLPSGSLLCFMGNMRCYLRGPLECVWKRSSETSKGSAVKVFQHTQLPF